MKIRTGFVSNSSSSSFIIGLCALNEKIQEDCVYTFNAEDIVWEHSYMNTPHIIINDSTYCYEFIDVDVHEDFTYTLSYESFTGETVKCKVKDGDKFMFLCGVGPDDDGCFWNEEAGEYEYDKIDVSDFSEDDQKLYNRIIKLGGSVSYGAGRNG